MRSDALFGCAKVMGKSKTDRRLQMSGVNLEVAKVSDDGDRARTKFEDEAK